MAVSMRRSGFRLWVAWAAAAALGFVIAQLLSPQLVMSYGEIGVVALWAPMALLQFFVLRAVAHLSPGAAGLWVVATISAVVMNGPANLVWYQGLLPRLSPWLLDATPWSMDLFFEAAFYFFALLLGVAQGLVLVRILGRKSVFVIWVGVNVAAWALGRFASSMAITGFQVDLATLGPGPTWPDVLLALVFGAITGAALVALMRWRLAPAPIPVAA